ncbi:MAG TPA: hypothetical protein VGX23_14265 [Actinocrinis sp.]|nr:hypothetical protein [Actinocrinis sp.]
MYLPTPLATVPSATWTQPDDDSHTDALIPSAGLSLDSDAGPVDLVAVDRVRRGHPTPLTRPDLIHLLHTMPRSTAAATLVAEAFEQGRWGHATALTRTDLVHLLRTLPRTKAAAVLAAEALFPA